MHGFSGSGKTWLSGQLMGELPAVRVRSDIERKRIHGLAETAASVSGVGKGLYTDSANEDVYTTLCLIAKSVLRAGHDVILDASFLEFRQRERARQTAIDCGAEFLLIEAKASNETLRDRIQQRVERTSYCRFVESLYSHASRRALLTQSQDSQAHRLTLWFARAFWAPT
jgi:hypothetical protein